MPATLPHALCLGLSGLRLPQAPELAYSISTNALIFLLREVIHSLKTKVGVIVVLIMRFRRRGCFLGGFSSVNYERGLSL